MTSTAAQPPSLRLAVIQELEKLEEDLLWTEKIHFAIAETFRKIHFRVGGVATVAGAGAATSVIAEGPTWLSGLLAVVGAVSSALVTFVKPQESQQEHLTAGRRLGALRIRVRQTINLDLHPEAPEQPGGLRELASGLAEAKAEIDDSSPSTSDRAFERAGKKIEKGNFVHGQPTGS